MTGFIERVRQHGYSEVAITWPYTSIPWCLALSVATHQVAPPALRLRPACVTIIPQGHTTTDIPSDLKRHSLTKYYLFKMQYLCCFLPLQVSLKVFPLRCTCTMYIYFIHQSKVVNCEHLLCHAPVTKSTLFLYDISLSYFCLYLIFFIAYHSPFSDYDSFWLQFTVFVLISAPAVISAPPHISHLIELIFLNMTVFKTSFYHVSLLRYWHF